MNNNGRHLKILSRRKSDDYILAPNQDPENIQSPPHRLKSVDENDEIDNLNERREGLKEKGNKRVRIKRAARKDDEAEIKEILSNETNEDSVQELLSEQDERGLPCIFHALESRSRRVLALLLQQVKKSICIIALNGETLLHMATKMDDVDILKSLLEHKVVCDLVNHAEYVKRRTPLHLAAKFNHVKISSELLLHGAKLDPKDITGKTPVFLAAFHGYASLLKDFLQYGREDTENLILNSSLYPVNFDNLLQVAVASGDEKTVQVCLDQDQEIVRKCLRKEIEHPEGGFIHSVSKNGMKQCLSKMVDCMSCFEQVHLIRGDRLGYTPMHKAAVNNRVQIVKLLGSISKSFVNHTTVHSQTALVLAAEKGHINVVKELLSQKADFKIADDRGKTVLHYGIQFPALLKVLLDKKDLARPLINKVENNGCTPVHKAALNGLCESLKILLENGGELNVFTNKLWSPLHCAVSSQSVDVVQLVLSNEPALLDKADKTGKTPLHFAASHGNTEVVRCLLEHGAHCTRDQNGDNALHLAAYNGHLLVVELLLKFYKDIIDWEDKSQWTALIAAALTGKSKVVKFLLDEGAAITKDCKSLNCLDWCLKTDDKETAMTMMLHRRWNKIIEGTEHGAEKTMAKLVQKMPEVAYCVLSKSVSCEGHCDDKGFVKRYDFLCLQSRLPDDQKSGEVKPMIAIKTMVKTENYRCLSHPVCCKFLKAKWMEFGWKLHTFNLSLYIIFLVALSTYAFQIPSYKDTRGNADNVDASVAVKLSMVICLIFAGVNAIKEIIQLIFIKLNYFLDLVNYLEWVMFVCVFIFATPKDGKIAVKTSLQWKACSIALLLAWINLVLYLRRFALCGIYVLMMKKICSTLIKVLLLFIFFFFAFAAAFTSIMNDKEGFENFGRSVLTSAVMTTGEIDFKATFLDETNEHYKTFYWLRLTLLLAFLVLMPIILMNLLLALAIDDTSNIMQQAKLNKHIETANMIIKLERKRSLFPWFTKSKIVPPVEEYPNKPVDFRSTMWEFLFYGPDFTSDGETMEPCDKPSANHHMEQNLVDMIKEMQEQISTISQKMNGMQKGVTMQEDHAHCSRETLRRHAGTQFHGYSESFDDMSDAHSAECHRERSAQRQCLNENGTKKGTRVFYSSDDVFSEDQDMKDENEREKEEIYPKSIQLKELHNKMSMHCSDDSLTVDV